MHNGAAYGHGLADKVMGTRRVVPLVGGRLRGDDEPASWSTTHLPVECGPKHENYSVEVWASSS